MKRRNEIRKDPIIDKYVVIAPRRNLRPHTVQEGDAQRPSRACAFCPEQVDKVRALAVVGPKKRHWKIKVIRNIYPAVSLDNPRAYGTQEVVIETPDPALQLDELPVSHIEKLFAVYAQRTKAIARTREIEYIMVFKNSGGKAGASIQHSHSQVFATRLVPPQLLRRAQKAREYFLRTHRCAYCDMVVFEEKSARKIFADRLVSVFAPFASENNYEVWIFPRRHIDNVTMLHENERRAIAAQLKKILQKISKLKLDYNYYFHQVINDEDQHFYIKVRPRGSVWAGVEIGSGIIINPIPPEDAAAYYRSRA